MKIEVTVCDVDRKVGIPVSEYTLTQGSRTVVLDLCETHAEPVEALLALDDEEEPAPVTVPLAAAKASPPRPPATPRGKRASRRVTTLDEIEALKHP